MAWLRFFDLKPVRWPATNCNVVVEHVGLLALTGWLESELIPWIRWTIGLAW